MQADLPHTLYSHELTKEDQAKRAKSRTAASAEVLRLQEEANREMEERRKAAAEAKARGDEPYEMDDLFN